MKKDKHSPGGNGPGGDSKEDRGYKHGSHGGPSPEQREKWDKLSDESKEKMKNVFRENRERLSSMTDEQRRSFIESNFKNISDADEASRNGK
jgi:Spy/CpxP family protein refolding chaperone